MTKEFTLPDLGEGIESGDIVAINVAVGDVVAAEQTVCEIETDKAVLDVPCPFGGKVVKLHVKQGDKASVGTLLLSIDVDAGDSDSDAPVEAEAPAEPEVVAKPEAQQEPEPEKPAVPEAQPEPEAPPEPEKPAVPEASRQEPFRPVSTATTPRPFAPPPDEEPIAAGPATRRLARELGIDLHNVSAAYAGERLTRQHVKDFVKSGRLVAASTGGAMSVAQPELPDFAKWGQIEKQPFSSLQRKTADNMQAAWLNVPRVTQFDEADAGAIESIRKKHKAAQPDGPRVTGLVFVMKAVVQALKEFPKANASLDLAKNELILKQYYHIGIAVDTEAGLIVPVIRDVDQKSVTEIAAELSDVAERTRQRKIGLDELRGGTFTITNLGGIGGTAFTPIVNYPEVAILGMARYRKTPAIIDGQLVEKLMLPLCLSYDHRVINGADGARFTRRVAELIENPDLLLLNG